MCGIAGIAGKKDEVSVQSMLRATAHRGPDDSGMYADELCTLGHNRLSIIDLSAAGHQPMLSPDGRYVMVYNGEIYNYREQKEKLQASGISFVSQTDSEVLLHLYIRYGKQCVEMLEGMFAFAIWDRETETLFCARDRFGVKPFYYLQQHSAFYFCSEVKGLLSTIISPRIQPEALQSYLMLGYVPAPLTIIQGIESLLPGHWLTCKNGNVQIAAYTTKTGRALPKATTYEEAKATVKSLMHSSVKQQLISDVPVGLFLSGGLDSTVTALLAAELAGKNNLHSYSICYNEEGDESAAAAETADFYGTQHHAVYITPEEVANDFDRFITSIDQPTVDGLNSYLVAKHSRKDMTVALSGLGGDELFFGYNWQFHLLKTSLSNNFSLQEKLLPLVPASIRKVYLKILHRAAAHHFNLLYSLNNNVFDEYETAQLLQTFSPYAIRQSVTDTLAKAGAGKHDNLTQNIHEADVLLFMGARLREGDSTAMIHSLEVRFPFLDTALFDYVNQLPDNLRLPDYKQQQATDMLFGNSFHKRLLYDTFKNDLPPAFGSRQKQGFKLPHQTWMQGILRERIINTLNSEQQILNKAFVQQIYNGFVNGTEPWSKVWNIFILLEWCNKYKVSH